MYKTKVIKQIDKTLIREWQQLWNKAENANVFNSYEWFLTSMEVTKKRNYEIYACYEDNKLVAILPLEQYSCFGVKVWGTINKEHLIDTAFLMKKYDKKLFKAFFGKVLDKRTIYMQKVDSQAVEMLHKIFPKLFFSLISANPIMDLSGDLFATSSHSTISQVSKILRKNSDQLRFVVYANNLDKHLKTMFKLHESSSKKARAMDVFADERNSVYYTALTKNFSKALRICFLYLNDLPIAYQYGFLYRDIFVGDQIAYHNEYGKLRPGKIMVYCLAEYLKKNKVKTLDQGGGVSSYKMEFTDSYRLLFNIYYSPNIFIMIWWETINKVRRIKQLMFPKKFTRDHEFLFKTI